MTTIVLKPNSGRILTQIRLSGGRRRIHVMSKKSMGCDNFPKPKPGDSKTQIRKQQDASPREP
jgi:hypothetical protein